MKLSINGNTVEVPDTPYRQRTAPTFQAGAKSGSLSARSGNFGEKGSSDNRSP